MKLQDRSTLTIGLELIESPSLANTDDSSGAETYHAPPTISEFRGTNASSAAETQPRGRFVAGDAFFNYDAFGSLRADQDPVRLQDRAHFGLLVNAAAAGYCTTMFQYLFCPLLVEHLSIYHHGQTNSAKYLLQWPGAFSVFIGLASDCFPLVGFRRKSYMLLGWSIALVMFASVAIVFGATPATASANGYLFLIFSLIAALGLQIAWIASLAMTVEFAQREHLYQRGHLQSLYLLVQYIAIALTMVVCSVLLKTHDDGMTTTSHVDLGGATLLIVGGCLVAVPFVAFYLLEDRSLQTNRAAVTRRVSDLWHFLQHKVVYNMLFFLVGIVFLNGAQHNTATQALALWSGVPASNTGTVNIVTAIAHMLAAIMWKAALVNYSWRRLAVIGVLFKSLVILTLTLTTSYAVVREAWFFYLMTALSELPHTWLEMFAVVPPTEIADVGREGATVGLVMSFMVLISIATKTLWDSVSDGFGLNHVRLSDVLLDSSATRNSISLAAGVYIAINVSSVLLVGFTPTQKLDAQHLRSFGGYNPTARLVLLAAFLTLLTYSLVANLVRIFS